MNLILCNEKCRYQKEGYCGLEGSAKITNALTSPCCYFDPPENAPERRNKLDKDKRDIYGL